MRMDIAKFLEEQKFCKIALSGLLTPAQLMFCDKQAKQVVRHGNMRSTYSSDEELFNSDDSVMGGFGSRKVGVVVKNNDNFAYVDAMTNRLNETDLRLLRASINDRPQQNPAGDNEGGSYPDKFLHEADLTNQDFERKVKFDARAKKPDNRKNQIVAQGSTNITNNYSEVADKRSN
jgi:predicted RND superfamily exporter protein